MSREVPPKRFTLVLAAVLAIALMLISSIYVTQKVERSAQPGQDTSGYNPSQGSR